jgi:hypothetical protein
MVAPLVHDEQPVGGCGGEPVRRGRVVGERLLAEDGTSISSSASITPACVLVGVTTTAPLTSPMSSMRSVTRAVTARECPLGVAAGVVDDRHHCPEGHQITPYGRPHWPQPTSAMGSWYGPTD